MKLASTPGAALPDSAHPFPIGRVRPGRATLIEATFDTLSQAIREKKLAPGSRLPSELELIRILGVSRTTLREAFRLLEDQGLITRQQGIGTFVSARPIRKDLSLNFGITEMIRQAGLAASVLESAMRQEPAPARIAVLLGVPEGARLALLERVRAAGGAPVVLSRDYLLPELLDEAGLAIIQAGQLSLYDYLEQRHHIQITRGLASLKPILADNAIAKKLAVARGSALMCMEQTDYDSQDRPVVFSIEYHLPEAFEFVIMRRGPR